jgi:hypothetical protein
MVEPFLQPQQPPAAALGEEEEDLLVPMTSGPRADVSVLKITDFLCCVLKFISRVLELLKS